MDSATFYQLDAVDEKILTYVRDRLTYQEMADGLDRSARSGLYRRVEKLIALKLVTKSERKSRSRRLTDEGKRILDSLPSLRVPTISE